jgi:hypothetical protein
MRATSIAPLSNTSDAPSRNFLSGFPLTALQANAINPDIPCQATLLV